MHVTWRVVKSGRILLARVRDNGWIELIGLNSKQSIGGGSYHRLQIPPSLVLRGGESFDFHCEKIAYFLLQSACSVKGCVNV